MKDIKITMDKELCDVVLKYSKELKIKRSEMIEKAVRFYFNILDETISDKRIHDVKSVKKASVVSMEDLFKKAEIDV